LIRWAIPADSEEANASVLIRCRDEVQGHALAALVLERARRARELRGIHSHRIVQVVKLILESGPYRCWMVRRRPVEPDRRLRWVEPRQGAIPWKSCTRSPLSTPHFDRPVASSIGRSPFSPPGCSRAPTSTAGPTNTAKWRVSSPPTTPCSTPA